MYGWIPCEGAGAGISLFKVATAPASPRTLVSCMARPYHYSRAPGVSGSKSRLAGPPRSTLRSSRAKGGRGAPRLGEGSFREGIPAVTSDLARRLTAFVRLGRPIFLVGGFALYAL